MYWYVQLVMLILISTVTLSHPTIGMETSSSSSSLTNTAETGTDTNEQVSLCFNNQGIHIIAACASDTTDYPDSI